MALYNAFRYNYSHLNGCSLLVDIGARTTNLLFIESARVFSRSVPIGGGSITSAIAREFDEPFAAAELRKKRDGFVSLGGAYAEPSDPDLARMSKMIRSTMTRLHAELMRSISHYRGQQQGSAPQRVFLCGGSVSTPYMREFFQEKLQLPVAFFNPLRNVAVAQSMPADRLSRSAHLLGELVGLALRTVTACPMELNLRPASVVKRQTLEKRRLSLVVAACCFVLALAGWGFYHLRAAQVTTRATEHLQEKIDTMHAAEARLTKLRQETTTLDNQSGPLIDALNERSFWVELVEDLNSRLPKEDIWITELIPTSGGKPVGVDDKRLTELATPTPAASSGGADAVRSPAPKAGGPAIDGLFVRGLYLFNPRQQEVVVDFFKNLVNSPFFAIDPNNQSRVIKPSTPNKTEWAFPYELHLDLKKPLPLPPS
jgi:type IV pilus assembly protein PilM